MLARSCAKTNDRRSADIVGSILIPSVQAADLVKGGVEQLHQKVGQLHNDPILVCEHQFILNPLELYTGDLLHDDVLASQGISWIRIPRIDLWNSNGCFFPQQIALSQLDSPSCGEQSEDVTGELHIRSRRPWLRGRRC